MRVAVTGARNWPEWGWQPVYDALTEHSPLLVIHGGAVGLDMLAGKWARERGIVEMVFPYAGGYGKRGGHIRNGWMLTYGQPDIVLAFPTPESRGTWDMVRQARERGIPVKVYGGEVGNDTAG